MRNCTDRGVATAVAAATTKPIAAKPRSRLQFTLHCKHEGSEAPLNAE